MWQELINDIINLWNKLFGKTARVYTYETDPVDPRDRLLPELTAAAAAKLPKSVDLRPLMSAVEDQGSLGSCTGNAIAGALEYLDNKNGRADFVDISRLFIYYSEREIEGTINEDSGAYIRDGVKAVNKIGACTEKLWPYKISKFKKRPSAAAYVDAANRKITEYLRVTSLTGIKKSLADGFPVVFGFNVYPQFESEMAAKTGIVAMPVAGEQPIGGHAVLAVGYDEANKCLLVRNSWGEGWGMAGYFWLPYGYITKKLADDFWSIRK